MGRRLAIVQNVQMGCVDQPSHRNIVDAATSTTTTMTYAQAAAQTHAEVQKEKGKDRERGPNIPRIAAQVTTSLPYRLPFREDMSDYEKEGDTSSRSKSLKHRSRSPANTHGSMTKAVVVYGMG